MPDIICIVGPTASGKTRLSLDLAEALNGEIVSCDSMQLYRGMDIGTAKPTREEMRGIPHHMIGILEPDEDYSVGRYVQEADAHVQDILSRGRTCIIVGGTGLYVDSLMAGRDFAPFPETGQREALERQADELGMEAMLRRLAEVDPDSARRLHPKDRKRILRALEVYSETGITITEHNRRTQAVPPKYAPCWIGLDYVNRADLYARIDLRVTQMLEAGLMDEIRALLERGVPEGCTALQAIGYKELLPAVRGERPLDEAIAEVQQSSRRYAKRQLTWFRRNEAIRWIPLSAAPDFSAVYAAARQILRDFDKAALLK